MRINERALRHWIDHFFGYGTWSAPVWFIAYEEHGGEFPEEVAERVDYFLKEHPSADEPTLCDIRDMRRHIKFRQEGPKSGIYENLYYYRFGTDAMLHGAWKNLIAFEHGFRDEKIFDVRDYQRNIFVSPAKSKEALLELYPLPSPHHHSWYYNWLDLPSMDFLRSRKLYQSHVYERRMNGILSNIAIHQPELVLMFGMDNINHLKSSVQLFFEGVKFKLVQGIKQKIPSYHLAQIGKTKILITTQIPTLRHNRPATGFDWFAFGESLRG